MLLRRLRISRVQMEGGGSSDAAPVDTVVILCISRDRGKRGVVRALQFSYRNVFISGLVVLVLLCSAYQVKGREA